jgi:hypothetical protein
VLRDPLDHRGIGGRVEAHAPSKSSQTTAGFRPVDCVDGTQQDTQFYPGTTETTTPPSGGVSFRSGGRMLPAVATLHTTFQLSLE